MNARSAAPVLIEYLRPAHAFGEGGRERLDVVQEEALGAAAQLLELAAAADLLDGLEEVDDLLGQRRLADAAAPGAEHLDLAV